MVKFGPATSIHAGATSKLLISLQREEAWSDWFGPKPYAKVTSHSRTRYATLKRDLLQARKALVAYAHSEQYEGISGASVPVLSHDGQAAAGIGILMIGESMTRNRARAHQVLKDAAAALAEEFKLRRITAQTISMQL